MKKIQVLSPTELYSPRDSITVRMENMDDTVFWTSDITLAAVLYKGNPIVKTFRTESGNILFGFDFTDSLVTLVEMYNNNEVLIEPKELHTRTRYLYGIIKNYKY